MTDEAKAARREYMRQWAREHPEKLKEYKQNYWERKAQQQNVSEKAQ